MDDWSLLPSRNAESEPAPNPQSPMTSPTLPPARLTRPRQAPTAGADHPRPQTTALDPAGLARQPSDQSGAKPQNPNQRRRSMPHRNQFETPKVKDIERPLDITRPFMDDTGRPRGQARPPAGPDDCYGGTPRSALERHRSGSHGACRSEDGFEAAGSRDRRYRSLVNGLDDLGVVGAGR